MAPKPPETMDERMYASEVAQEDQEKRISKVEALAMEALEESRKTTALVEGMPAKVVQMIDDRNRGRKLDIKDWALFCFAAVSMIGTVSTIMANLSKVVTP